MRRTRRSGAARSRAGRSRAGRSRAGKGRASRSRTGGCGIRSGRTRGRSISSSTSSNGTSGGNTSTSSTSTGSAGRTSSSTGTCAGSTISSASASASTSTSSRLSASRRDLQRFDLREGQPGGHVGAGELQRAAVEQVHDRGSSVRGDLFHQLVGAVTGSDDPRRLRRQLLAPAVDGDRPVFVVVQVRRCDRLHHCPTPLVISMRYWPGLGHRTLMTRFSAPRDSPSVFLQCHRYSRKTLCHK